MFRAKTLNGLIELVPVLISIVLILFIVNWADSIVRPLPFVSGRTWDFPGIGLVIGIVVFYLLGVLLPTWAGKFLVVVKDLIFSHIPVVSTVFGGRADSHHIRHIAVSFYPRRVRRMDASRASCPWDS